MAGNLRVTSLRVPGTSRSVPGGFAVRCWALRWMVLEASQRVRHRPSFVHFGPWRSRALQIPRTSNPNVRAATPRAPSCVAIVGNAPIRSRQIKAVARWMASSVPRGVGNGSPARLKTVGRRSTRRGVELTYRYTQSPLAPVIEQNRQTVRPRRGRGWELEVAQSARRAANLDRLSGIRNNACNGSVSIEYRQGVSFPDRSEELAETRFQLGNANCAHTPHDHIIVTTGQVNGSWCGFNRKNTVWTRPGQRRCAA